MALTDQGENLEAIARYMGGQVAVRTDAAARVRDEWQVFWSGLSSYAKNFEQNAYDRARNYRLAFDRANATTEAERAAVEQRAHTGLTTEQIEGEGDRRTSTGEYVPAPSSESTVKRVAIGVVVALGALALLKGRF